MVRHVVVGIILSCLLGSVTGCSSMSGNYVLEGKVVRGSFSSMSFVSASDSRLTDSGVPNVQVFVFRNPNTLGRELAAQGVTDDMGRLRMPIREFGAGWMVEDWMLHTYIPGFQSASTITTFPKAGQDLRLLITLGPGVAERPPMPDDVFRQYEQFR